MSSEQINERKNDMEEKIYRISNGALAVEVTSSGAQIRSIKNSSGKEYMWCADPAVWGKSAPIMFPICGGLKDGSFYHNGRKYELAKHGFGSAKEYEAILHEETVLVLRIVSDEETKKSYPFDFQFSVKFELCGNALEVSYITENTGNEDMYYAVGAHEAYACPEGIEEYDVIFDCDEHLMRTVIEGNLLGKEKLPVETDGRALHMKYSHMDNDCLVFYSLASDGVVLKNRTTGRGVRVEFSDFAHLVLWTMKDAPYLCIEPWQGVPDSVDETGILSEKDSMQKLAPGKTEIFRHRIIPIA